MALQIAVKLKGMKASSRHAIHTRQRGELAKVQSIKTLLLIHGTDVQGSMPGARSINPKCFCLKQAQLHQLPSAGDGRQKKQKVAYGSPSKGQCGVLSGMPSTDKEYS